MDDIKFSEWEHIPLPLAVIDSVLRMQLEISGTWERRAYQSYWFRCQRKEKSDEQERQSRSRY